VCWGVIADRDAVPDFGGFAALLREQAEKLHERVQLRALHPAEPVWRRVRRPG